MVESIQITVSGSESDVLISAAGVLDLHNSQELKDALKTASQTADSLAVDLKSAHFIDTAIVQYLAQAGVRMMDRGKRLKVVVAEGSHPQQVIRTVGFDQLMEVVVE